MPLKVVHQAQQNGRSVLPSLNVGDIDSWGVLGLLRSLRRDVSNVYRAAALYISSSHKPESREEDSSACVLGEALDAQSLAECPLGLDWWLASPRVPPTCLKGTSPPRLYHQNRFVLSSLRRSRNSSAPHHRMLTVSCERFVRTRSLHCTACFTITDQWSS